MQDSTKHWTLHAVVERDEDMKTLFQQIVGVPVKFEMLTCAPADSTPKSAFASEIFFQSYQVNASLFFQRISSPMLRQQQPILPS